VDIELPLEQLVHRRVEVEGEGRRLAYAQSPIQIEAAGAIEKIVDLRPAQAERLG
jgi:hypothetical protein